MNYQSFDRILIPVDCKRPEWQTITDGVVSTGSCKHLRGTTPPGLPPGGYWDYRKRVKNGRVYLMYSIPAKDNTPGKAYAIASVDPEYADLAVKWQPQPNSHRRFDFVSGPVVVHYDALALPARIEAQQAP